MAVVLYNVSVRFYRLIIGLVSPFNEKAKKFVTGRENIFQRLQKDFSKVKDPVAWFHCASLGEFEQGRPVIEAFRKAKPNNKILITFFSPSGYELRKNYTEADFVYYLPIDTKRNAQRFLNIVNPALVIFVKYEFWYHYLKQTSERKIPLYCISALFNKNQRFFKPSGGFFRKTLTFFDHIFVQNEKSKKLLQKININQVSVAGDTRFDRVVDTVSNPKHFPLVAQFSKNHLTMVIGSCWPADMTFLYPIINRSENIKFIIAPHDVSESSIKQLEKGLSFPFCRITEATPESIDESQIIIINTIGMLSSLYQYGQFSYIGGAFGDGLHNILEAVTFGLPVIFGNNNLEKFPEALALIEKGGAFSFTQKAEIDEYFEKLSTDIDFRKTASEHCKAYIRENTGATAKIMYSLTQWNK
ncbi:3-deoxy-D-manno-octulosonic acid transferase [Roseivirga sp.]|uniref:3-deoxy-D-manno-octulosonic acid transferase n=1 Tax=Roseivirga sp. TaxID=1964215 RepID=UPI002B27BC67|nr:glycosyltransferase N-terminal domain-containing protein [Roseivirga sp.]